MRIGIPVIHPGGHVSLLPINTQESEENAHTLSPTFSLMADFPQMHGLNFKAIGR
jgi:hypothetical protein